MSAVISSDEKYRYWLEREVPRSDVGIAQAMGVIMINPSTADHTIDDATIRRLRGFASGYGVEKFCVANLFALRTPDVKELSLNAALGHDIEGPENGFYLDKLFEECKSGRIIVAFGSYAKLPDEFWDQPRKVIERAVAHKIDLWCWGHNKDLSPKHPLYLPKDAQLEKWRGRYDFW